MTMCEKKGIHTTILVQLIIGSFLHAVRMVEVSHGLLEIQLWSDRFLRDLLDEVLYDTG